MSTRFCLASAAAACLAFALITSRAGAADVAAQAEPVWKGFVPDNAFYALVAYPRRVVAKARLTDLDAQMIAEEAARTIGFSPLDLEQAVVLFGPLTPQKDPQIAIICRLSNDFDQDAFSKYWFNKPERYLVAGHRCVRKEQTGNSHDTDDPAACFLDDRTFVFATQGWLPAVLRAKNANSKLISALGRTDTAADLTMLFTSSDAANDFSAMAFAAEDFPDPLKPISELTDWVAAAKLSVYSSPEISLKLAVLANNESDATKFADFIKTVRRFGQQMLPVELPDSPEPKESAEGREARLYARKLAEKFLDQFVAKHSGKQVTIEINHLGTVASLFHNLVLPPMREDVGVAAGLQDLINLKQIASAMHSYVGAEKIFPANAIYSKDGKPLLSWRVALLPYLGEEKLYKEFRLDEPWDGEHNKALIAKMPAAYTSHAGKPLPPGQTRFVVPVGKDTIFDWQKGIVPNEITDGLSKTILALEVGPDRAVTWTKPDDMPFDPQKPFALLGAVGQKIPIVSADGSAIMIRREIAAEKFRDMILRNDGHFINFIPEISSP